MVAGRPNFARAEIDDESSVPNSVCLRVRRTDNDLVQPGFLPRSVNLKGNAQASLVCSGKQTAIKSVNLSLLSHC